MQIDVKGNIFEDIQIDKDWTCMNWTTGECEVHLMQNACIFHALKGLCLFYFYGNIGYSNSELLQLKQLIAFY